jgi:HSP20 family molecular chaperone IbpA
MTDQVQPANGGSTTAGNGAEASKSGAVAQAGGSAVFAPPADIYETRDDVQLYLDMPGADPATLDVTLDRRILAVSARSTPWQPQGYVLIAAEYQEGNYARSFVLSDNLDGDKIEANFRDGVLRLRVPKSAPSPAKKISVNAG